MKLHRTSGSTLRAASGATVTRDVGIRIMGYSTTNGPSTTVNGKSIDHAATISDRSRA